MKEYQVTITETLERTILVKAKTREEAEKTAERGWNECVYVLDADDFTGATFHARQVRERGNER